MTGLSKQNYEDDDGRIMKTARKQQYIMFPAPISFLDDELKAELGMKAKKEKEEETSDNFCFLRVPIDHDDKESNTYTVKVKSYNSGSPEEFLKWRLILAEQVKNNGYTDNPDNIMNLVQSMLAGRSLEAFLNEKRSQEAKNRVRKSKTIAEHTPSRCMTSQYLRLIPKVDGEMPMKDNKSTRGEVSSWESSIRRSSVKDCKTYIGTWTSFPLKRLVTV
jgi:hypothetical protein